MGEGNRLRKTKERDILIESDIIGLARNLEQDKFPGIHKDEPR